MACNLISLATALTIDDVCSSTTFTNYYIDGDTGITLGVTAFTDSGCTLTAPNGFYVTNGYRQTWGEITGAGGVFSTTGICYDCGVTGYTILVGQLTSFRDCCNPGNFFNLAHDLGTFSIGETYYINSNGFVGCATVVDGNSCYPIYNATDGTFYADCESCLIAEGVTCPFNVCQVTSLILETNGLTPYDDIYTVSGSAGFNDYTFFVGETTSNFLFYDSEKWCLSTTLGGGCLLVGNPVCNGVCPDICGFEVFGCTTTTTNQCDIIQFDAIFDCDPTPTVTPTPSITPTITNTPQASPTPTSSPKCLLTSITLSGTSLPGPTPTPTKTPSPSLPTKICNNGEVTYNLINSGFDCPPVLD